MRRAPAAGLWLFSRLEPDVRRLAAFAVPNVYTCMTNAGEYIPGRTTDYAACRVPYDHMFDLGALVEAGAAAGLRIVLERQIPASPHVWGGWGEGIMWTMNHRGVSEASTLAAIMQWWQSVGSPSELRLHQPNNLVNVDESRPNNADYVALAAGVKWNPRFDALVKQSRLPGAAEPLRAGTYNVAHIRMEWDWYTQYKVPQEAQLARQEYIAAVYAAFIAAHGFRADFPLIIVCELMPDSVMKNLINIPGLRVVTQPELLPASVVSTKTPSLYERSAYASLIARGAHQYIGHIQSSFTWFNYLARKGSTGLNAGYLLVCGTDETWNMNLANGAPCSVKYTPFPATFDESWRPKSGPIP
jgi:hypothetical protein